EALNVTCKIHIMLKRTPSKRPRVALRQLAKNVAARRVRPRPISVPVASVTVQVRAGLEPNVLVAVRAQSRLQRRGPLSVDRSRRGREPAPCALSGGCSSRGGYPSITRRGRDRSGRAACKSIGAPRRSARPPV